MKNIILSIIAVSLLTLVSFSNVVGYNTVKTSQEELIESEYSFDDYTPIQLVFLLINKLRYYEGIDSEEDVLEIIESDAELSGIVEELESFDCGCEDEEPKSFWGDYPIICIFLTPFKIISVWLLFERGIFIPNNILNNLGEIFGCWWVY